MGKLLSFLAKITASSDDSDLEKQESIFKNIAENDQIEWNEPQQRNTVVEATQAARRLSLYQQQPFANNEHKQYSEDRQKVERAIDVIKENYKKENKVHMELVIQKVKQESETTDTLNQNETENKNNAQNDMENQTHNQIETENTQHQQKQIETQPNIDEEKQHNISITNDANTDEKQTETETKTKEEAHSSSKQSKRKTTYSGIQIQIDQCYSFKHQPWILDKDRDSKQREIIKNSYIIDNIDEYHSNRRVSLSNSHNFLWFTTAIQSPLDDILDNDEKLTRKVLNIHLNLLPIPFVDKIWAVCILGDDAFIDPDDYAEFVDSLLIATGQFDIDDDIDELGFEIRDMNKVFCSIVDVDNIFKIKSNTSRWSKTALCLSTKGATELIKAARNIRNGGDISLNASDDMAIALFTGFTRRALKHAVTFCTQIFWKVLTDIWWNEDEEDDVALPMSIEKYALGARALGVRTISKQGSFTKISDYQKQSLNAMSMEVLFPDLVINDDDEYDVDHTFTEYLKVIDSESDSD